MRRVSTTPQGPTSDSSNAAEEPDLLQHDAKQQAVRSATVGLATVMSQFLDDAARLPLSVLGS